MHVNKKRFDEESKVKCYSAKYRFRFSIYYVYFSSEIFLSANYDIF